MKRKYKIDNLECANCAAKMERAISKLDGVDEVSVNFMTQTLTISAADDIFDGIMKNLSDICKKIEPNCSVRRCGM